MRRGGWHVATLEWSEKEYVFYLDGVETWRTSAGGVSRAPTWLKFSGEIADLSWATGKGWAGPIDPKQYPDYFMVDWVRVYERMPAESQIADKDAN